MGREIETTDKVKYDLYNWIIRFSYLANNRL